MFRLPGAKLRRASCPPNALACTSAGRMARRRDLQKSESPPIKSRIMHIVPRLAHPLLVPQRLHRIHPRRPHGRDEARRQRHSVSASDEPMKTSGSIAEMP